MDDEQIKKAQAVSAGRVHQMFLVTLKTALAIQLKRPVAGEQEPFQVRSSVMVIEWPLCFRYGHIGDLDQLEPMEGSRVQVRVWRTALDAKETKLYDLSPSMGGPIALQLRSDLVLSRQEMGEPQW